MPPELTVSVVVTNYETAALTQRCVENVARFKGERPVQVVVVDDASKDRVKPRLPAWVEVVENASNQGYVRSVNIGLARAQGDIVLLLDSDAAPLCDVFTPAVAAFVARPRLGALGFHLVDDADRTTGSAQPEPTVIGLALGQQLEARFQAVAPGLAGRRRRAADDPLLRARVPTDRRDGAGGVRRGVRLSRRGHRFLDAHARCGVGARSDRRQGPSRRVGQPTVDGRRVLRFHANRWRLLEKHGRIVHPRLLKTVLAARHAAELAVLGSLERFAGQDPQRRADKLASRKQLLATVWNAYRGA